MNLNSLDPQIVKLIANGARMSQLDEGSKKVIVIDIQNRLAALYSRTYKYYYPDNGNEALILDVWCSALSGMSVEYVYRILHAFISGQIKAGKYPVNLAEFSHVHGHIRDYVIPDLKSEACLMLEHKS